MSTHYVRLDSSTSSEGSSSVVSLLSVEGVWYIICIVAFRVALLRVEYQLVAVSGPSPTPGVATSAYLRRPRNLSGLKGQVLKMWYLAEDVLFIIVRKWIQPRKYNSVFFISAQLGWGALTTMCFMQLCVPNNGQMNSLFKRCDSVDVSCVDEQYLFAIFCGMFLSFLYGNLYLYHREYLLHFPNLQQTRWFRFKERIAYTLAKSAALTAIGVPLFYIIYFPLYFQLSDYTSNVLSWIFSSSIYIEPIVQIDLSLMLRLMMCGIFLGCTFYFPNHIMEIIHTESFSFELNRRHVHLIEALSYKQSPIIQHLAFLDLYNVSLFSFHRRGYLFGDETDSITTSIYDIKKIEMKEPSSAMPAKPTNFATRFKSIVDTMKKPQGVDPFAAVQLQIWAIEAITTLTALSIKEDRIGVVQNTNTLPVLLNSLLACLLAVEEFIQTPLGITQRGFGRLEGYQLVRLPSHAIIVTLHNCIYKICTAFYENLTYFKFSPKHAARLQSFLDFKE